MPWPAQTPRGERVLDKFAEALAETGDVAIAAASLGLKRNYADALFCRIKRELGRGQCR